jgi:hypothetical protein
MIIYLSLLVCIVGLVIFFLNNPPRNPSGPSRATWAEVGRIMFGVGLFVFLLTYKAAAAFSFLR